MKADKEWQLRNDCDPVFDDSTEHEKEQYPIENNDEEVLKVAVEFQDMIDNACMGSKRFHDVVHESGVLAVEEEYQVHQHHVEDNPRYCEWYQQVNTSVTPGVFLSEICYLSRRYAVNFSGLGSIAYNIYFAHLPENARSSAHIWLMYSFNSNRRYAVLMLDRSRVGNPKIQTICIAMSVASLNVPAKYL